MPRFAPKGVSVSLWTLTALVAAPTLAQAASPFVATASQAFVDRIGVNIHADFYWTAYDNFDKNKKNPQPDLVGFQNIESALRYLGIKHVRDSPDDQYFLSLYPKLNADLGVKFDFYIGAAKLANDPTGANTFAFKLRNILAAPNVVDYAEGANESDNPSWSQIYGGVSGLPATLVEQRTLLGAVNSIPQLYGRTIQASFAKEWNIEDIIPDTYNKSTTTLLGAVPGITAYANFGNSHIYYGTGHGARNPGAAFPPYNDDPLRKSYNQTYYAPFGQTAMMAYNASLLAPGKPVIATESGYHTTPNDPDGVDTTTQAKYILTLLFDQLNAGIVATYLYDLVDDEPDPKGTIALYHYGLYNDDWSAKPAATAIHNVIFLMSDSGSVPLGTLNYRLTGAPSTLAAHLFQRHNGVFVLALWNDVPVCGPYQKLLSSAPQAVPVTIQLPQQASQIQIADPLLGTGVTTSFHGVSSFTVPVPDHPVLISITGS